MGALDNTDTILAVTQVCIPDGEGMTRELCLHKRLLDEVIRDNYDEAVLKQSLYEAQYEN